MRRVTTIFVATAALLMPTVAAAEGWDGYYTEEKRPAACNMTKAVEDELWVSAPSGVKLRNGMGTKYASLGLLTPKTRFYAYCFGRGGHHEVWAYGKVLTGAHKGRMGWVHGDYVRSAP